MMAIGGIALADSEGFEDGLALLRVAEKRVLGLPDRAISVSHSHCFKCGSHQYCNIVTIFTCDR
jgi:hypothetical protein